ncbi:MAG: putative zinc-binding metallopeptidase [Pseudomonadota bacterium]
MKRLTCQNCRNDVFFDSTQCVHCGFALGYAPATGEMLAAPEPAGWEDAGGIRHTPCANRDIVACNFLTEDAGMCVACRHNRVIPDLSQPGHAPLWAKIEAAKRVLFYSILAYNLPHPTKVEDETAGLAFDFLADETQPDGSTRQHMTGHASGLITINIAEGDDAERERRRTLMGEPYRTLVGHFRHEIGHYYWDRLVATDPDTLARCRALFGDDRADYGEALQRHYDNGPCPDWRAHHISAYASAHPWEDFAETFAHFVHMVDGLETAAAFGLALQTPAAGDAYTHEDVADLIAAWVPTTVAVNAVNRSMGQPDLYPFVLSGPVREKLAFVSGLIHGAPGTEPND